MSALVLIFSVLAVASAATAVILSDMRKVIVASWVAGMSAGALFLSYGAEYLAIIQWLVGTLVAISFLIYASLFGGYASVDSRPPRERAFDAAPAAAVGLSFFAILAFAVFGKEGAPSGQAPDLAAVGQALAQKHVISLELLAFLLLAVLVGAGVIARPEEDTEVKR